MAMTDLENAQRFGAMLAKSRTDAGQTQKYMAQALGKSVNTIQNWESGVGEPGYRTLEKWFDALGINMELYILNYKYRVILIHKIPASSKLKIAFMRISIISVANVIFANLHFACLEILEVLFTNSLTC